MFSPEMKKGSMEMLILSMLDESESHGYEIGKQIEQRSGGLIEFRISTLYSVLYRIEKSGWIKGRWMERAGERRRCYYRLTTAGKKVLAAQEKTWREFVGVVNDLLESNNA
jgi:transcriptional regulator